MAAGYAWDSWAGGVARESPAAERNKQPLLEQLRQHLPPAGLVLEVASGTGQHVAHFAAGLSPQLTWQPTDVSNELFGSIAAHAAGLPNVRPPLVLDAAEPPAAWPVQERCAAVFAANVTHITPWPVTQGLLAGAGALLQPQGLLLLYGPFKVGGAFTSASNAAFHDTLVAQDHRWGYRDVADVAAEAARSGLALERQLDMPANNLLLLLRKQQ